MKEYKNSQFGWKVADHFPGNSYSIFHPKREAMCYLIPEEIWDALASATDRADNFRKSRDHFRQSRDSEKAKASEIISNLVENHSRLTKDLNLEIEYLNNEIDGLETSLRQYKAGVLLLGVISIVCFCATFII